MSKFKIGDKVVVIDGWPIGMEGIIRNIIGSKEIKYHIVSGNGNVYCIDEPMLQLRNELIEKSILNLLMMNYNLLIG